MREKLLIVDDEPGIVEMMASYFAPQYQVLTARSGAEALEKAGAGPDLILLDINMPGMDGLTVCQTIRDHIACPILFLTARIASADKIAGFQAGADDYIVKPFDLDELGARVAAHLRREQRRQCGGAVTGGTAEEYGTEALFCHIGSAVSAGGAGADRCSLYRLWLDCQRLPPGRHRDWAGWNHHGVGATRLPF